MIAVTFNWLLTSFLNGFFFFALFLFLFYWFYLKELPVQTPPVSPQFEEFSLNNTVQELLLKNVDKDTDLGMAGLNMLFQFLFQELKDTKAVRRYIIRKMSAEFKELLNTKAAGKIVNKITARDFSLGTSFPVIHSLRLSSYQMDKARKCIQELSLLVDIEYRDGFSLSIDADLILGRSAYVHVKIACIRGKARLQFTRHPFTHWNFAFIEEPHIDFAATSHFDGRQIPQLTTLILNQLRRSVRRKHTLPNYKCRFKPFFDMIYAQNLYKTNLDEMFAASEQNKNLESSESGNEDRKSEPVAKANTTPLSKQYRKLCESLGFDLSTTGELSVKMKLCERLPEYLCSLNNYQTTTAVTPSADQAEATSSTSSSAPPEMPLIHLTLSLDALSMQSLMSKQTCKEHWPVYEFELSRASLSQSLGMVFTEVFVINRIEVAVQRVFPNSLASSALADDSLRPFDIIFSLNQTRVTGVKSLNKLLQKTPLQQPLKFVVQRPCMVLDEEEKPGARKSLLSAMTPSSTLDNVASVAASPQQAPTTSAAAAAASSSSATEALKTSSAIYSSLSRRLQRKLNQYTGANSDNSSATSAVEASNRLSLPSSASSDNLAAQQSPVAQQSTSVPASAQQPSVVITNTASANCLVDYFTSVAEVSMNEQLPELDLMSMLLGETKASARAGQPSCTYFNSREIRLERDHLITYNNVPVPLGETFAFELGQQQPSAAAKYVNVFLWTTQHTNKNTKMKNHLVGYLTLPLHEVLVDCWNTKKGETQSTVHFRPIDDLKASASIARTPRHSHVLSDHPGFDASLAVGSITLQFQHKLNKSSPGELVGAVADELVAINSVETEFKRSGGGAGAGTAASSNANQQQPQFAPAIQDIPDDGTIHKFMQMQFNENVICEFCNKKIWMKNAYQCIYCGYVIHLKCYEKTIGKTICARFFANTKKDEQQEQLPQKSTPLDETVAAEECGFVNLLSPETTSIRERSSSPSRASIASSELSAGGGTRAMVSNLISGIRQRRWHNANEQSGPSTPATTTNATTTTVATASQPTTSTRAALLSSLNSRIATSSRLSKLSNKLGYLPQRAEPTTSNTTTTATASATAPPPVSIITSDEDSKFTTSSAAAAEAASTAADDSISLENDEEFKDTDSTEADKLFGVELYEDLPLHERKQKFEETIVKYRSTIDMMTNIKADLEKELREVAEARAATSTPALSQQEQQLKSQIKHLEEQMKGVVFLLMQCQIGLENSNEMLAASTTANKSPSPAPKRPPPPPAASASSASLPVTSLSSAPMPTTSEDDKFSSSTSSSSSSSSSSSPEKSAKEA